MTAPAGDLGGQVLREAFPFHLLVGDDGRVLRTGPSLRRACPALRRGAAVDDLLLLTSPRGASWSRGSAPTPRGLVLATAHQGPLVLRGQFLDVAEGRLLLGSPWVTSVADLDALGLTLGDFAPCDPVVDLLLLVHAQASALADATSLAQQVEAAAARQAQQARLDGLTGLANRTHYVERLEAAVTAHGPAGGSVAVVLLDLHGFREVNETLGHACGDRLLQQVGPRVQTALRAGELVARLGADEFAVLLEVPERGNRALASLAPAARRVLRALQEPFVVDGVTLTLEASAGLAFTPAGPDGPAGPKGSAGAVGAGAAPAASPVAAADGAPPRGAAAVAEGLLRAADSALHEAKASHLGLAVSTGETVVRDLRRLTLLADLRRGMDDGQLRLHYQPLLDLASGTVHAVEALVRWQHPRDGLLPPGVFLGLAEGSGAIHDLTREVLAQACAQGRAWQVSGRPLSVAVNISARCLMDQSLPDAVAGALRRSGLAPELLTLEITESAIVEDPARAAAVLSRLRDLGARIAVDDFGTGYTSLAHLRDLPVNELKIDRSFVSDMLQRPDNALLVRTVVELATRLGLESVAEGVEDEPTLQALSDLGCTTAQGFHLSRPVPADELDTWLARHLERAVERAPAG